MTDALGGIIRQMVVAGLSGLKAGDLVIDGKIHRFRPKGRRDKSAWYRLREYRTAAGRSLIYGSFGDWRWGYESVEVKPDLDIDPAEVERFRVEAAKRAAEDRKRQARLAERAARWAQRVWDAADTSVEGRSPYLDRKGVLGSGIRYRPSSGAILVPARNAAGAIRGLQVIYPDGTKRFWPPGMAKAGTFMQFGPPPGRFDPIIIGEGYATLGTCWMANNATVVVAWDCGNLPAVARAVRAANPDAPIWLAADDDFRTEGNPGLTKAREAAEAVDGQVLAPVFEDDEARGTDWNDLHELEGLEVVRAQWRAVLAPKPPPEAAEPDNQGYVAPPPDDPVTRYQRDLGAWVDHMVMIHGQQMVYDGLTHQVLSLQGVRSTSPRFYKLWMESDDRRVITSDRLVFDPGGRLDDPRTVNMFRGFELEPDPGASCQRFLELLDHLCGGDDELRWWVTCWLAYPLQHPGAKMRSALVIHGSEGTGKNLFFETVGAIYGRYGMVVGQAEVESDFNGWASCKLWCVADEVVSRQELRHLKGKLKGLVTGETIQINDKNMKLRVEANHLNVVFLSNEDIPVAMDPGDRRYCVVRCDRVHDPAYFRRLGDERARGAAAGLYHYLLGLDLGDFNEHAKPPLNQAKQQIIELCRDPAERFYLEWKAGLLEVPYQTCTAQDLYDAFRTWASYHGERAVVTQTRFGTKVGRVEVKTSRRIVYGGQRQRNLILYLIEGSPNDTNAEIGECCETFRIALQEWRARGGQQGKAA